MVLFNLFVAPVLHIILKGLHEPALWALDFDGRDFTLHEETRAPPAPQFVFESSIRHE